MYMTGCRRAWRRDGRTGHRKCRSVGSTKTGLPIYKSLRMMEFRTLPLNSICFAPGDAQKTTMCPPVVTMHDLIPI